jgi:outer membrane protein OmpA-like peptidoglycan-associated protein/tetratricopeptide (TPR) repeat protein
MKKISLTLFFSLSAILFAQTNVEFTEKNFPDNKTGLKSAQANFEKGDEEYYLGPQAWEGALKFYLKANEFNPNNARLNFQIASIYRQFNNTHTAADFYEKAIALDKEYRNRALLPLAEELHLDGQWDKAIDMYTEYNNLLNSKDANKIELENSDGSLDGEKKYVNMRISQCNNGKKNVRDSIPIIMLNMGPQINSKYPDYTAAVNSAENMIVFTSRRTGSTGGAVDPDSPFEKEDIYFSTKNEDGTWNPAKQIKGDVNSPDHDAVVWLSPKGDKIIIYRYNKNDNGDLYESENKNGTWSTPEPMKMINSKYRETHACYSPDGNTIYFTTANPKVATKGGLDICYVTKDSEGKWSEPKEIDAINTIYNEESPFIKSDSKTFYFSSQGHTSIGGFDIFKCEIDNGKFSTPKNVGFPINSTSNDVFIFFTEDGKKAFFDSDRKGGQGEKDIYEMYILDAIKLPLIVEVYDERTNQLISTDLSVIETGYIPVEIDMKNDAVGKHSANIGVSKYYTADARAEGYEPKKVKFNTKFEKIPDFDTIIVKQKIYLKPTFAPIVMKCDLKDKKTLAIVNGEVEIQAGENVIAKLQTVDGKCEYRLEIDVDYEVIVIAKGYKMVTEKIRFTKDDLQKTVYLGNFDLEELELGDKFVLKNVYFDYNKSNLRSESINELNILKEFLINNPDVRVEVSAHTDNRGSASYNYALSDSRAASVMEWLVSNGIDAGRLTSKGYGFDQPIAPNDSEENMQLNRRVEFKIIK